MWSCKQTRYDVMQHNDDVIIANVFLLTKYCIMYYKLVFHTGMPKY